jgi:hypothetical protein
MITIAPNVELFLLSEKKTGKYKRRVAAAESNVQMFMCARGWSDSQKVSDDAKLSVIK